ncbi:unnamed protein product [Blepharisma stoltei]|uniref:Uncharacterized protein n=1 Tax=Blepharisma stoltei TaxID=1481888 RepID=A0AAU9ID16_9CILI|nr:unnamed protein product [Blepharisma stoltei]
MAQFPLIAIHQRNIEEIFKEEVKDIFEFLITRLSMSPYIPNEIFFSGITLKDGYNLSIGKAGINSYNLEIFHYKLLAKLEKHRWKNTIFQQINQDIIEKEGEIDGDELQMKANLLYECDIFALKYQNQNWGNFLNKHLLNNIEKASAELQPFGSFKFFPKIMNTDGRTVTEIGKFKIIVFPQTITNIEDTYQQIIFEKEKNKALRKKIFNIDYKELNGNDVIFTSMQRFSVHNGKPHGYGVIETSDMKYTGQINNGKFHGNGVMISRKEHIKYEGHFENGYFIYGSISTINERFDEWCSRRDPYNPNQWISYSYFNVGEFPFDPFEKAEKEYTKIFSGENKELEGNLIDGKINGWGIRYFKGRKYMEGEFINSDLKKGKIYYYDDRYGIIEENDFYAG